MTKAVNVSRKVATRRRGDKSRELAWRGGSDTTADLRFQRTEKDEAAAAIRRSENLQQRQDETIRAIQEQREALEKQTRERLGY